EEMDDSLERAATTATSLDAEQDRGSGLRHQETMGDTIFETRFKNVSKTSNDPLLTRVLSLETTKTTQAIEIASLKRRVNKLERRNKSRTQRLKQVFGGQDMAEKEIKCGCKREVRYYLYQVTYLLLREIIHEEKQATTPTVSSQQPSQVKVQDKGKGIMVEEPLKMKKKDQIRFDEQEAIRLQAEFYEEERLVREKYEANVALTEEWNDIQAKIEDDYQLAQ
ncbi:hypothetical protein Tco_1183213, partial [Tanacetum coccineum]